MNTIRLLAKNSDIISILKNSGWLILEKTSRIFLGLFVGAWVARYLGPENFGELNYVLAYLAFFQIVAKLGIDGIVVRDLSRGNAKQNEILGTSFVLRTVVGFILWLTSIALMMAISDGDATKVKLVAISGLSIIFQASDTFELWFQSKSQSKKTVLVKLLGYLLSNSIKVSLIILKAPLIYFAFAITADFLICFIGGLFVFRRNWKHEKLMFNIDLSKLLLIESWPFLLSGIAIVVYSRVDLLFVDFFLTPNDVGIYAAVASISGILSFIPVTLSISINPYLSKAKRKSEYEYEKILAMTFWSFSALGWMVSVSIAFLSPFIVSVLFGDTYMPGANVLTVLVFSNLFINMGVAQTLWLLNEGLSKISLYKTIIGALSCVILNYLLIPRLGMMGAAYSTVASQAISAVLSNFVFAKNIFNLQIRSLFLNYSTLRHR